MQYAKPWSWGYPYSRHEPRGEEEQRAALSFRQETLKNELWRMRQQQLIEARRERREELRKQVQQLEKQVYRYQLKAASSCGLRSNPFETRPEESHTVLSSARLDYRLPGSNSSLIERLVQQNEHIMALLLPRRQIQSGGVQTLVSLESVSTAPHAADNSPDVNKVHAGAEPSSVLHSEKEVHPSVLSETQREAPAQKPVPTFQTPTALSWLPEFEWTDEDELALDKLEKNVDALPDSVSEPLALGNGTQEGETTTNAPDSNTSASKDQKARDRLESRKRLEALLSASLKTASGTALRKPRWRLESEAESDDVSPFEVEDAEVMEPIQIFRASVLAVLYTVQLKNTLMEKKLAEKESATRDFEAMLRVYFDATRMWLGKVVRTPLLSLLQDSSLDVDISSGIAGSSLRGFAKKFGNILGRRPPTPARSLAVTQQSNESIVDQTKLLKLKVRMRGILQSLSKAINKKEVPSGILDFWKRISSDGVYFPPCYQLFDEERQSLEFDALGATRRMDLDGTDPMFERESERGEEFTTSPSSGFSRFNLVLINFLLVRILIPHVILQPWTVGIGSKNIGKQTAANLASLATLLYAVCRQLSPLPAPTETPEASFLGRRRSKTIAPSQPVTNGTFQDTNENPEQPATPSKGIDPSTQPDSNEQEHASEVHFLTIDEIGRRLLPEKTFPSKDFQVVQVVREHQAMLSDTLVNLRSQLHGSKHNFEDASSKPS